MDQGDKEERSPEQNVRCRDDQEHLHPLYTFAFHSTQVVAHATVFLYGSTSTGCVWLHIE